MLDMDVVAMILGNVYVSAVKVSLHLGQDYQENMRTINDYFATGRSRQVVERKRCIFTLIRYFVLANILNQLKYGSKRLSEP